MFLEIRKKGLVRLGMGLVAITLGPPIALASATGPTGFAVEPPHDPSGMVRIQDDGFVEYMKLVQTSLRTLGLYDGPIDGVSPDTGAAMRKYLELTGADVDGPVQFGGRDQTDLLNAAAAIYRRGDISVGGAIEKAPRLVEAWRLLDQADEMGKAGQKEQKAQ